MSDNIRKIAIEGGYHDGMEIVVAGDAQPSILVVKAGPSILTDKDGTLVPIPPKLEAIYAYDYQDHVYRPRG